MGPPSDGCTPSYCLRSPVPCGRRCRVVARARARRPVVARAHARKACCMCCVQAAPQHGSSDSLVRALHAGSATTTPEAKPNTRAVPKKLKTAICECAISKRQNTVDTHRSGSRAAAGLREIGNVALCHSAPRRACRRTAGSEPYLASTREIPLFYTPSVLVGPGTLYTYFTTGTLDRRPGFVTYIGIYIEREFEDSLDHKKNYGFSCQMSATRRNAPGVCVLRLCLSLTSRPLAPGPLCRRS